MTIKNSEQDALTLAEKALEKTDKDKFPKLYESREALVKQTEVANNQKIRAEKAEKKTPKNKEVKPSKKPKDTDKLDYGQKAFLIANGIKGTDEHQLAVDTMTNSGKDLDEVIESKFFMSELKDMREKKTLEDATPPSSSSRSTSSPKNEVSYWIAKGELPPADQTELRQKVVNAKMKAQTDGNPFTDNPIVGKPTVK